MQQNLIKERPSCHRTILVAMASILPVRSQISTKPLASSRIISSVCEGQGVKRRRSVPDGTVGN